MFISKSFKELFFTAFFRKADAKVRTIFELPKLFRRFFSKSFFDRLFITLSLFQHFNLSAFLSRKRVQNYCFTAYAPNIPASFFQGKCDFSPKLLILKRCRTTCFFKHILPFKYPLPYFLTRARIQGNSPQLIALLSPKGNRLYHSKKSVAANGYISLHPLHQSLSRNSAWFLKKTSTDSADENKEFPAKPVKIIVYGLPPEDVASYRCKM